MSVQFDPSRNRCVVRWYDAGRQRSRRFHDESAARRFDAVRARDSAAARAASTAAVARELLLLRARVEEVERRLPADARTTGVYPCATRAGVRWRVTVTRADGTTTTRRGYETRDAAWRARERLAGLHGSVGTVSFGAFWRRWLVDKQPYLTDGAMEDLEAHAPSGCSPTSPIAPSPRLASRTSATG